MIIRPTSARLLSSVRDELTTTIAPLIIDDEALARLHMIDSILASVAIRAEHEGAWIREEIAAIEAVADAVIAAGADPADHIADALLALRSGRSDSDHLDPLRDEYDLAGEVLSVVLETVVPLGGDLRTQAEDVLAARVAREVEIRGDFSLAGRG